jgi:RND family efflux transporter MFP subunit|tara:strand:- start:7734 stop:8570 length:837 start_codon:yes stop_codon:yes gene_type:complete
MGLGAWALMSIGNAHAQSVLDPYATVGLNAGNGKIRGIVECRHDLELSFATPGVITETLVREGQIVQAGDVLMRLDQQIEWIEVDRRRTVWESHAELNAANARAELSVEQLAAGQKVYDIARGISREDLQNRKLAADLAHSELARLETQKAIEEFDFLTAQESLKRRTLTSSAIGIVSKIVRRTGESAQANDPVLELCDISALFFVANLPVKQAETIVQGQAVTLHNTGRGIDFAGEVSFVSPVVDSASGLRRVKIQVIDPPAWLSPGTSAVLTVASQ